MKRVGISVGIDFSLPNRFYPVYVYNGSMARLYQVNLLMDLAEEYVQAGNVSGALNLMRQASNLVPGDPKLFNICAGIFFDFHKYEEMAEFLRCAIGLSPRNPYLHIHRAWALARQGKFEEAREEAWSALRFTEERTAEAGYCHFLMGFIELLDKRYWQAAIHFYVSAEKSEPLCRDYKTRKILYLFAKGKNENKANQGEKSLIALA